MEQELIYSGMTATIDILPYLIIERAKSEEMEFFIPSDVLEIAMKNFDKGQKVTSNIKTHLFPLLLEDPALLESLAQSCLKHALIENGILGGANRQIKGDVYYFDKNGIYCIDQGSKHHAYYSGGVYRAWALGLINQAVWASASTRFPLGATLDECISIYLKTEIRRLPPPELDLGIVTSVGRPVFERVPGNRKTDTFDRVRVTITFSKEALPTFNDLKTAVIENKRELVKMAANKLSEDKRLLKYGVSLNYLHVVAASLRRDWSIEYVFELKDIG